MADRTPPKYLATALRWPLGLLLTWWAYTWRITPLHRGEQPGDPERDAPPPLPAGTDLEGVQLPIEGSGAFLRRRYRVDICEPDVGAERLMGRIKADVNSIVPGGLAHFHRDSGGDGPLGTGDVYVARMPGPWDGPVRVIEETPTSFRFVTLEGHLEAGQIEWRAEDRGEVLRFEVQSWSRPGDRFSAFAHHHLRAAKEVQLHMWTSVLEKATKLAGGRMRSGVEIRTWVVDEEAVDPAKAAAA